METTKEDISKLYTINDFAKAMNVDRRTVYNWMTDPESKNIKIVNISGKRFIKLKSA